MPARDARYVQVGTNSGGDRVYARQGNRHAAALVDYEGWTKDELSEELESRGLTKSGNKDELIARLQEDDG